MSGLNALSNDTFSFFLQEELLRRCRQNPRYSVRAFARMLHMDFSTLSKLLRGERMAGPKLAARLVVALGYSESDAAKMILSRKNEKTASPRGTRTAANPVRFRLLDDPTALQLSDWYYRAMLELMSLPEFCCDVSSFARTLGISVNEVNIALERLEKYGLAERDAEQKWKDISGGHTCSMEGQASSQTRRTIQKQVLEKALLALDLVPVEERLQTSLTLAIPSSKIEEAKVCIRKFREQMDLLYADSPEKDRIYHLSISFYPVSEKVS